MRNDLVMQRNAGRAWQRVLWTVALVSSASSGLLLGLGEIAQSNVSKYQAILEKQERVPGEAIVKLNKAGMFALESQSLDRIFRTNVKLSFLDRFEIDQSLLKVKVANDNELAEFLSDANQNPAVAYAEPNYVYRTQVKNEISFPDISPQEVIPPGPDFGKLWGLKNTGQNDAAGTPGKVGADIGATKAWDFTKGSRDIVVAVIDTGVDYNHPLLKDNIYINQGEYGNGKEKNGVDDDGNGFIDDFHGWNFATGQSTNDPMDDNNHGSHVSGTIGASGADNGIVGVNWRVSILPIKFLSGSGSGSLEDAVKSIKYATLMKVNLMSNSWGGGGFSQTMFDAIAEAKDKGVLFVAAAGNDGMDNDKRTTPTYPSSYQVDNVISVAASTNTDGLASFSNYGKRLVHIAAPGHKIYSTVAGGKFDTYSGTSMATPHVAGAAALLWSTDKKMTYAQIKDRLLKSRDYVSPFSRKIAYSGRLNVYNAINNIFPPSPPEPKESDWKTLDLPQAVETPHPYTNNFTQEWVIEGPANAKFIRVNFGKIDIESGYDFITVTDDKGVEIDSVSGKFDSYNSWYAEGNKVKVKFTTDVDVTSWGFQALKYQVIY